MDIQSKRFLDNPIFNECLNGTATIKDGDYGEAVLMIQLSLLELNYTLPEYGPDADFGPETASAVSKFKTDRQIYPNDGIIGKNTMAALDRDVRADIIPDLLGVTNKQDVARILNQWFIRVKSFVAGIGDSSIPPFSGICHLDINGFVSDTTGLAPSATGTGFLIAPDRIVTAAHNFFPDKDKPERSVKSISITPGQQDQSPPFDQMLIEDPESFVMWDANFDRDHLFTEQDLAVIKLTSSSPAPVNFELEELLFSPSQGVAICGYGGSYRNVTISSNRQHMDIGAITEVYDDKLVYALQSQTGNSGSPIFYTADERFIVVGVHTASNSAIANQGCRLTQEKIAWIKSI